MPQIQFTQDEKNIFVQKLKRYFDQNLDQEIGQFDAEDLLEFFSKEIGVYHYNKGLRDAQIIFKERTDMVIDAIYELEVTTEFSGR